MNHPKTNLHASTIKSAKGRAILNWIKRYAAIEIAVLLSLAIAAYFFGRHILDTTVPGEGDVRSHILKIELLQSYLSHFSWPQWNPYWYHGIPEDQFYPPGFYFLGTILSYIVRNSVIAYKIMLFLAMAFNGFAIYYFSRQFLKFDSHLAIWCLVAYITSTPILINFMYGEGPNLFGWSVTIIFLTIYLSQVMENKTNRLFNIMLPGLILGLAILVHPFPVLFAGIVIIAFHIVWLLHNRHAWKTFLRSHLPYIAGVAAIGGLIGMYYWLPAFLTLPYSSPIYSFTNFMWIGGVIYLLIIIFLAIAVVILTRFKVRGDPGLDTMIIGFCIACALGFGGTRYLPFGLGSLVQEFRFAAIIAPFFGILLIVSPLKYKLFQFNTSRLLTALVIAVFLTAFVFGLNQRDGFVSGFQAIPEVNPGSLYQLLSKEFAANFPGFAVAIFPYFAVIIFLALSLRGRPPVIGRSRPAFIIAGGVCLLLLISFIPYINTNKSANLGRLFDYIDNYEQSGYAQIMNSAQNGRMIVPMNKGYLTEGDSPVTFGRRWGVEIVNGPYNQGDPKFFKFTVHLEWEERWLNYTWTRENLMQESAAKYIFIRDSFALPSNLDGMTIPVTNPYGKLLELNQSISFADKVTPVLVDAQNIRNVTEFFNILLPGGYKMVLVDIHDIPSEMADKFNWVMLDDESKIFAYRGKTVFLLKDSTTPSVVENQGIITLNVPYLTYTNRIFYHGEIANGYLWIGWDNWPGARITPDMQNVLINTGNLISPHLNELEYTPVSYKLAEIRIDIGNTPGFTLIKDSYFPYWKSQLNDIVTTSQGFMLIYSNSSNAVLNYQKPLYYLFATSCSVLGMIGAMVALLVISTMKIRERNH
jgi:hypothetical protein